MRILVVFRGENKRWNNGRWHDVRMCIPNNKVRLINSLRSKGYIVDIIFCTYDSEYLNSYVDSYNPLHVYKMPYEGSSQHINFNFVLDSCLNHYNMYNKIIILRFDLLFKKNITEWPMWDKAGIMFPWKDHTLEAYNQRKYCQEVIISIDTQYFKEFKTLYQNEYTKWKDITWGLHFLTTILDKHASIPFFFMEGDIAYESNTYVPKNDHTGHNKKNPYLINAIYDYALDDRYLVDV